MYVKFDYFCKLALSLFIFSISMGFAGELQKVGKDENFQAPVVNLIEDNSSYLILEWNITNYRLESIEANGQAFKRLVLDPMKKLYSGNAGEAELPDLVQLIKVPNKREGKISQVDIEWEELDEQVILYPRQIPLRGDDKNPDELLYDEKFYSGRATVPEEIAFVGSSQGWGGTVVAGVSITPVKYVPESGAIAIARTVRVRVDFEPSASNLLQRRVYSPNMDAIQKIALINPPENPPEVFDLDENEPIRMLFVLREEALEESQPLIDFHHNQGLRSDVFLADDLEGPEELKETVAEYYVDGLEYLMLIGDGWRNDWDVPMFFWDPEDPGEEDDNTDSHSDSWYVCLDEPDRDGFDDHLPDLAVGRLTYTGDELNELNAQVAKTMNYLNWDFEEADDDEWLNRCVLIASDARDREFVECKEDIRDFDYNLAAPEFITYFNGDNGGIADVIADINETGFGFFNYRGHGDQDAMNWRVRAHWIETPEVNQMENSNRPSIVVSSACWTANLATTFGDCILEDFQKHDNGGSVAANGSVISSYTDGNDFFDRRIFRAFFDDGVYSIGYATVLTLTEMVIHFDRPANDWKVIGRMNTRANIWLGDPALEYKLSRPFEMTVAVEEEIPPATEELEVLIRTEDEPVAGVLVCVRSEEDEIYQTAISNEEGIATIIFDPVMRQPGTLTWNAYHRQGMPISGEILVADEFGWIEGTVSDLETGDAIGGAFVELTPFHISTTTEENGTYILEDVPQMGNYSLTVTAETYLPALQVDIQVVDDEDPTVVNFELRYGFMEMDSAFIQVEVQSGEEIETPLTFRNSGNGEIEWSSEIIHEMEPYELQFSREMVEEVQDTRLYGVVFKDAQFFVAGGNTNSDPNFIYILDQDGGYDSQVNQPMGSSGVGIHDMAWDGEYFYGSAFRDILLFSENGELERAIQGPFNSNVAITIDGDDGNLWVANNRSSLMKIDLEGNLIQEIEQGEHAIRGLAWYPDEVDGYNILIMVRDREDFPALFAVNPDSEDIKRLADLTFIEGDIPSDALYVTNEFQPGSWSLVGMSNQDDLRFLNIWHLSNNWITMSSNTGTLEGGEEDEIVLTINTENIDPSVLEANIVFENNGRNPRIEIPITAEVLSVDDDFTNQVPREFEMSSPFPNPFNSSTNISFSLPKSSFLDIKLYDIQGRLVEQIFNGTLSSGSHNISLSGETFVSGVYILQVNSGEVTTFSKIALIR